MSVIVFSSYIKQGLAKVTVKIMNICTSVASEADGMVLSIMFTYIEVTCIFSLRDYQDTKKVESRSCSS